MSTRNKLLQKTFSAARERLRLYTAFISIAVKSSDKLGICAKYINIHSRMAKGTEEHEAQSVGGMFVDIGDRKGNIGKGS